MREGQILRLLLLLQGRFSMQPRWVLVFIWHAIVLRHGLFFIDPSQISWK